MKREILLNHECIALASQHGLGGLYELAQHLHQEKAIQRGDTVIHMDCSDDPTTTTGFYFAPAAGEGGVLMAHVGMSHEENGLEGVRLRFQSHEIAEAQAALLDLLRLHEPEKADPNFSVV